MEAWILLILTLGLAVFTVYTASGQGESAGRGDMEVMPRRTTYSAQPGGCKAFYLALQQSGYNTARLRRPWTDPPPASDVLVSLSAENEPSAEEWDALASWVRGGGLLILAPRADGYEPETQRKWSTLATLFDSGLTSGVEFLGVYAAPPHMRDLDVPRKARFIEDAGPVVVAGGRVAASYATLGKGGVLLLDAPEIAANDGIAREGNLRFLLNAIGPPTRKVWFDEFHHGNVEFNGVWSYLPQPVRSGLLMLAVGGLVLLWALSRRLAAPVADRPVPHERSEYVDSMASLLKRAGATALVARLWRKRLRDRLARELGGGAQDDLGALTSPRGETAARHTTDVLARLDRAVAGPVTVDELMRLAHDEADLWKELKKSR